MRKRLIAALTVVAVLSFGGVAFAENIYEVHIAKSSPEGEGHSEQATAGQARLRLHGR